MFRHKPFEIHVNVYMIFGSDMFRLRLFEIYVNLYIIFG